MEPEKLEQLGDVESGKNDLVPTINYTKDEERAVVWKQDRLIIPLTASIYFLCYLDRSNIGNARILNSAAHNDMQTEIGATPYQFNIALMIFLVAYAIFEVPSNILLKKLRPSRWLAFLMFSWGAITIGLGGVQTFSATAGVRFLLGASEAGLFPGLVYYLTFWYKTDERSVRVAFILASATLAGAFGGAIAYGIGHMNGAHGLSAWRWLFIIEGVPSCLSAFLVYFFLPDYPEEFHKGKGREISLARLHIEGSKSHHSSMTWQDAKSTLTDWRLYGHYLIYFGVSVPFSSLSLFTPSITAGLGYVDLKAQLMTVPPYAVAYVVQLFVSYSADRFNSRGLHSAVVAFIGAVGFMTSALLDPKAYLQRYGCLILASAGAFSCIPPLLGWLTSNVYSTASVGLAVALNVGFGAGMGQIPGVWIYKSDEALRGYPTGHWVNAGMLFFVAVGSVALRLLYGYKNRKLREGGPDVRLFKL
ncbi:major facilitator superfamily domain-containing protein [Lasiosphaeria miniovina]|uniref:Major facilitator superfamily domain-containing protein n=1 Tax=Lasiosphaeria miniovina TaxID=1954250 RepID=A0AA40ABX4_9PEZI|nr:major facilitator superfamily domain-containing protein [Lasiosphaeria miniovina]KAK0712944.1 major facilitator superfamily domain-containing protein [Lasiosphaeria miniovina]